MTQNSFPPELRCAVEAAQAKQAAGLTVLDLCKLGAFADYFLICTGFSARQVQAITDEVEERVGRQGAKLRHREGREAAEWVLLDYGHFIVHVFSERARLYYDLERLWRSARRTDFPDAPAASVPGNA